MSNFMQFKKAVQKQFARMAKHELFVSSTDKDTMWERYLTSFPEGTNPMFRERAEHDCGCCRQFIKSCGNVVAIIDNKVETIWDINIGGHYQVVADAMSALVKSNDIGNIFLSSENKLGTDKNRELSEVGQLINEWHHFYFELPTQFVKHGAEIGAILSEQQSRKDVFKRGITEITTEAIDTVLELISQNSLYRGEEHKKTIEAFSKEKAKFDTLTPEKQDIFCWVRSVKIGGAARLRNSVIGTLLTDLSEGVNLETAVESFETKVAPQNYKRTTALVTKRMIDSAQKKVEELGILSSLSRRFAVVEDITVNNVLFVDRDSKKAMNVFDDMSKEVLVKVDSFSKVEEVSIDKFINDILPKADRVEVMFENRLVNNLMSLIAPIHLESKGIFKWANNFSWSYNGEVTDSIKDRVKKAGGRVDGILRCSLSWFNYDDLDIHVIEPNGNHIKFPKAREVQPSSGVLDVDMNVGDSDSRNAVENIIWTSRSKIQEGKYKLFVNNFTKREDIDVGFDVEIEYDGSIHSFHYPKMVRNEEDVTVAEFHFSLKDGLKFIQSLPSTQASKTVWDVNTQQFQKVSMIMTSPNHWDGNKTGNKHWFFIMHDCINPNKTRGFYNEFLHHDLTQHRKVFELMSSKMMTEQSDKQLSGLGFSSTQGNHLLCKVSGSFSRTIKLKF
ncbi:hypothetical protein PN36_30640 [Candidatus Thiomargarita nelsonii]|uniref:Uncharacterized protein n=1 Tax=Candidatus Thiomargarita nelsonii TaxID=1003181 RepID=A0A0A6PEP4_9GAMM|nr:hypothetical protein PN36_30640 [Candidatus Thiomargarita nelsonii]